MKLLNAKRTVLTALAALAVAAAAQAADVFRIDSNHEIRADAKPANRRSGNHTARSTSTSRTASSM